MLVEDDAPDWWGDIENIPTGLTEDRYVKSVEIREVNDVPQRRDGEHEGRHTVGGRFVVHHMIWSTRVLGGQETGPGSDRAATDTGWPVHEVGREPDIFDEDAGRLLRAGSSVVSNSVHLHSNGRDTRAHLEIGFRFHPPDYEPKYRRSILGLGNGSDIDIRPGAAGQELHAYKVLNQHTKLVTFEPHLHAPGMRMCLEAIWGFNVETLNCAGYDHNWVRGYTYAADHQPLLPKGTILHLIGYMDTSEANRNVPDTRNWQGSGNRSVANMFIDLGMRVELTDEQFVEEMAMRRHRLALGPNDHVIGCPLCMVIPENGDMSYFADAPSRARIAPLLALILAAAALPVGVHAQTYARGQNVAPAFEGWEKNEDGSFNFLFGYMNRNWLEEIDVPVGEDNMLSSPGPADRGQPTRFLPRRTASCSGSASRRTGATGNWCGR